MIERAMLPFQQQFDSYDICLQVTPRPKPFVPSIGKIKNHFVLSYDLP